MQARIKGYQLLSIILVGPILVSMLRKSLPGQPAFIEALPLAMFFSLALLGGYLGVTRRVVAYELLTMLWIALVFVYSFPALSVDYRLWFLSMFLATAVPLTGIVFLRESRKHVSTGYETVLSVFIFLMGLQFLLGVIMLTMGNEYLPDIFRANKNQIMMGKEYRLGQPVLAGYFTTSPVNSIACLVAFGLSTSFLLRRDTLKATSYWLVVTVVLFSVVWMTGRRGVFFGCCLIAAVGALCMFLTSNRSRAFRILGSCAVVSALALAGFWLGLSNILLGDRTVLLSKGKLDLDFRLYDVFYKFLGYWLEVSPMGNYTGYASGVGKAFAVRDLERSPAEVGAAMLVAEQGIIGLVAFISVFVAGLYYQIKVIVDSGQLWCLPMPVTYSLMFLLFFFKENSVLFPGLFGSLAFWSLPGLVAIMCSSAVNRSGGRMVLSGQSYLAR